MKIAAMISNVSEQATGMLQSWMFMFVMYYIAKQSPQVVLNMMESFEKASIAEVSNQVEIAYERLGG